MSSAGRSGLWLGVMRLGTQAVSWSITILVARILVPADYGLVELAVVVTGFVEVFSEFGLGAAVVQKSQVTREELSSLFWLSGLLGLGLVGLCAVAAGPAAAALGEPRVAPIVLVSSLGFLIGSTSVVPLNLLARDYRFKELGTLQFVAVLVSGLTTLTLARGGLGVWALVLGMLVLRAVTATLALLSARFRPRVRLRIADVRPYVRFGLQVVASRSLHFVFQRADRVIVGGMLGLEVLGHYALARHLAALPNDKILAVVGQVSYPILSRNQDDVETVRSIYLRFVRYVGVALAPAFLLGALFGDAIIPIVLGEQWTSLGTLFRWFCVGQFIVALTAINSIVHNAQGRPHWVLAATIVSTVVMLAAVYVAALWGLAALAIPWVAVYPLICLCFALVTIRRIAVRARELLAQLRPAAGAALVAIAAGLTVQALLEAYDIPRVTVGTVTAACTAGLTAYVGYLVLLERSTLTGLWRVFR